MSCLAVVEISMEINGDQPVSTGFYTQITQLYPANLPKNRRLPVVPVEFGLLVLMDYGLARRAERVGGSTLTFHRLALLWLVVSTPLKNISQLG